MARLVAELRQASAHAWSLTEEAQAREAAVRGELVQALGDAQIERAERLQALARRAYFSEHPGSARPRLLAALPHAALSTLGEFGAALQIIRAGLWRVGGAGFWSELRHVRRYLRRGADPQAVPAALFDQAAYLGDHPDVAAAGRSPLLHYLKSGGDEGRSPHPLFDARYYAQQNGPDLAASGLSPLAHFMRVGARRGRDPHPLFDLLHYAAQAPDLEPGEDMPSHYVRVGWRAGLTPSPLFDPAWYAAQAKLSEADGPALVHYLRQGAAARLSPHPLFNSAWYLERNPDVAASGAEPLGHFLLIGAAEGRDPSPWFDLAHYVAARGDRRPVERNPLVDYLQVGAWSVSEPAPGFAAFAYLAAHPELVRAGLTPLEHWARAARR